MLPRPLLRYSTANRWRKSWNRVNDTDMAERMAIMEQMLSERVEEKRGPGRPKKVEEPVE